MQCTNSMHVCRVVPMLGCWAVQTAALPAFMQLKIAPYFIELRWIIFFEELTWRSEPVAGLCRGSSCRFDSILLFVLIVAFLYSIIGYTFCFFLTCFILGCFIGFIGFGSLGGLITISGTKCFIDNKDSFSGYLFSK